MSTRSYAMVTRLGRHSQSPFPFLCLPLLACIFAMLLCLLLCPCIVLKAECGTWHCAALVLVPPCKDGGYVRIGTICDSGVTTYMYLLSYLISMSGPINPWVDLPVILKKGRVGVADTACLTHALWVKIADVFFRAN